MNPKSIISIRRQIRRFQSKGRPIPDWVQGALDEAVIRENHKKSVRYEIPKGILDWLHSRSTRTESGCLLWNGAKTPKGYGKFLRVIDGKKVTLSTHRTAYEIHHGPIPVGMMVCHTCDIRNCIEDTHLFVGTPKENFDDCRRKGRWRTRHGTPSTNPPGPDPESPPLPWE